MNHDVFISYSRKDQPFVDALREALEKNGVRCWQDKTSLRGGDEWSDEIGRALKAAPIMILVFSSNSVESENVKDELSVAAKHKRLVVPIRIEDIEPPDGFWELRLSRFNRVDALEAVPRTFQEIAVGIAEKVEALRAGPAATTDRDRQRETYRERVRCYLEDDGRIDAKERALLEDLKGAWRMDEEVARSIEADVRRAVPLLDTSRAVTGTTVPAERSATPTMPPDPSPMGVEGILPRPGGGLVYPLFTTHFCRVRRNEGDDRMVQLDWPTSAWRFLGDVKKRIESLTERGWPAGFVPASKLELDSNALEPCLTVQSWKAKPSRWYEVDCSPHDGGNVIVQVGWFSESDRQIKALSRRIGTLGGFYLVAGDRLFTEYLATTEDDIPCYFTAFLVDPTTMVSEQFTDEIAAVFLALVEKVSTLGSQ